MDLSAQTVVVLGTASVDDVQAALAASGRKSRLIGQGSGVAGAGSALRRSARAIVSFVCVLTLCRRHDVCAEFDDVLAEALGLDMRTLRQSLAAVVEYKGREWGQGDVIGVVRFVQVLLRPSCLAQSNMFLARHGTWRRCGGATGEAVMSSSATRAVEAPPLRGFCCP